jgi:hypothetical protein
MKIWSSNVRCYEVKLNNSNVEVNSLQKQLDEACAKLKRSPMKLLSGMMERDQQRSTRKTNTNRHIEGDKKSENNPLSGPIVSIWTFFKIRDYQNWPTNPVTENSNAGWL